MSAISFELEICSCDPGISVGPSSEVSSSFPERTDLYVKMAALAEHRAECWTQKDACPNLLPTDVFLQTKAV